MDWLVHHSVVQFIGHSSRRSSTSCGYCRTLDASGDDEDDVIVIGDDDPLPERRSICFGMGAIRVYTNDVSTLMNRGWSWSGRYLYKPIMDKTCCPLYTIRLDASQFTLSRSQKRVLKVWRDFLQFDKRPDSKTIVKSDGDSKGYSPKKLGQPTPPRAVPRPNAGQKKRQMRKDRAFKRMAEKGIDIDEYQRMKAKKELDRRKSIEDFVVDFEDGFKHRLEIRIVTAGTPQFEESYEESLQVYIKYQQNIHNDRDCTRKGYQSFLVDNPFVSSNAEPVMPGGPPEGAHHQQYLIDGRIVAVGVIDVLPDCVSSAYFYYDPDYKFLNFGTYSALREIELVRRIRQYRPECKYYYMGYYVHNCRKMKYKAAFRPSELLCERTHQWVPLPECLQLIDENHGNFTVFRPADPPALIANPWICRPISYNESAGNRFSRINMNQELAGKLSDYARLVGSQCGAMFVII